MQIRSPLLVHQFEKCINLCHSKLPPSDSFVYDEIKSVVHHPKKVALADKTAQANLCGNFPHF
jgi:hypothetical protein